MFSIDTGLLQILVFFVFLPIVFFVVKKTPQSTQWEETQRAQGFQLDEEANYLFADALQAELEEYIYKLILIN